jgi:hypothetical protein
MQENLSEFWKRTAAIHILVYSGGTLGTCKHGSSTESTGLSNILPALYVQVAKFDSHKSKQTQWHCHLRTRLILGFRPGNVRWVQTHFLIVPTSLDRELNEKNSYTKQAAFSNFIFVVHLISEWKSEITNISMIIPCLPYYMHYCLCVTPLLQGTPSLHGTENYSLCRR